MLEPPAGQPALDPRTRTLLITIRRALLMAVAAIDLYIGYSKQITTQ